MICFDEGVAKQLGVSCAILISQIKYWTSKGFGKTINGSVYIYNTYEQWHKQLPFMSLRTIRRSFKKLVKDDIVFTHRFGFDRTSYWALNYSHPMWTKWTHGRGQNGQMDVSKMACSVHTLTKDKQTKHTPRKSFQDTGTTTRPTLQTRSYREDYKENAEQWLVNQTKDFQDQVTSYVDYHCNNPTTRYPQALKMKIIVEIWKKHTDQPNHTDFTYINKEELEPSNTEVITFEKKEYVDNVDAEMEQLYLHGGI